MAETLSSAVVVTGSDIVALWPRWMASAGTMLRMKALVRSRCLGCGALLRIELEDVVARHGPEHDLVDRLERCRAVGCIGSTYYLAARGHGGEWRAMLRDPGLLERASASPPMQASAG